MKVKKTVNKSRSELSERLRSGVVDSSPKIQGFSVKAPPWDKINAALTADVSIRPYEDLESVEALQQLSKQVEVYCDQIKAAAEAITLADNALDPLRLIGAIQVFQWFGAQAPSLVSKFVEQALECVPQGLFIFGPDLMGRRLSLAAKENNDSESPSSEPVTA